MCQILLLLVDQSMAVRLKRLDGDNSNEQYIEALR